MQNVMCAFEPGCYYIGDMYVADTECESVWRESNCRAGVYEAHDGEPFAVGRVSSSNTHFFDTDGCVYMVYDNICILPRALCSPPLQSPYSSTPSSSFSTSTSSLSSAGGSNGRIITSSTPIIFTSMSGVFNIIFDAEEITIDTRDDPTTWVPPIRRLLTHRRALPQEPDADDDELPFD